MYVYITIPTKITQQQFWCCAFEYNQYNEFINYLKKNNKIKYITFYNRFFHNPDDILILYLRRDSKKAINAGIFGYCILDGEDKINDKNIIVFNDYLVNRCYSLIDEFKITEPISIKDVIINSNMTSQKFVNNYVKQILKMTPIPYDIGIHIKNIIDKKKSIVEFFNYNDITDDENNSYYKLYNEYRKKKSSCDNDEISVISKVSYNNNINKNISIAGHSKNGMSKSDNENISSNKSVYNSESDIDIDSESDNDSESDSESDTDSCNTDDTNNDTRSSDNTTNDDSEYNDNETQDEDNKNGCVPILIELCDEFKIPRVKNKKKYNESNNENIKDKCEYIKNHCLNCLKCNIINNNNNEMTGYMTDAKILFKELDKTTIELDNAITRYQTCKKYDGIGYNVDKTHIIINHILDKDNIYDKCILLCITLKS